MPERENNWGKSETPGKSKLITDMKPYVDFYFSKTSNPPDLKFYCTQSVTDVDLVETAEKFSGVENSVHGIWPYTGLKIKERTTYLIWM
jgi:hypothetical protein